MTFQDKVHSVLIDVEKMLVEKNQAYGNSALNPVRVFSTADPSEQIRVRIDDKLSRLARGKAAGEDTVKDLLGYLVLLLIAEVDGKLASEGVYRKSVDDLNQLRDKAYQNGIAKGFHDKGKIPFGDYCANLHEEISELWTAYRKQTLNLPCDKAEKMAEVGVAPLNCMEEELADVVIRICDMAGAFGIDLDKAVQSKMAFNATRPYRHGGKVA